MPPKPYFVKRGRLARARELEQERIIHPKAVNEMIMKTTDAIRHPFFRIARAPHRESPEIKRPLPMIEPSRKVAIKNKTDTTTTKIANSITANPLAE